MRHYKYLNKKVKDVGKKGLSHAKEFTGIIDHIVRDYRSGKITKKQAMGRLLLLYRLTYKKNNKNLRISSKKASEIRKVIKQVMRSL